MIVRMLLKYLYLVYLQGKYSKKKIWILLLFLKIKIKAYTPNAQSRYT